MLIHPPWRTLAEDFLKGKDPELYQALKRSGELNQHLDEKAESARQSYASQVKRMDEKHPTRGAWVLQSAQESVMKHILDPTTYGSRNGSKPYQRL